MRLSYYIHNQIAYSKQKCHNIGMLKVLARGLTVLGLVLLLPAVANAQVAESPSFSLDEVLIGTGGDPELCGDEYCSQQSSGGLGVGQVSSDNYGLFAGFGTPDEPTMLVTVDSNIVDLGVLNTSTTSTGTANFTAGNYLSNGYEVRILGNPPSNSGHPLDAMDGAGGSILGVEQFGINLVYNDGSPTLGADPVQVPDDTFSYGEPALAYGQPNIYKYEDGDIIARSDLETGLTEYTMSIIANVATSTPGGRYKTVLVIQVVATF